MSSGKKPVALVSLIMSSEERVEKTRVHVLSPYDEKLREFLGFVLGQYVNEGVGELLELKYQSAVQGAQELGGVQKVRNAFIGFQAGLYET